jgi:hypothetical protein
VRIQEFCKKSLELNVKFRNLENIIQIYHEILI